MASNQAAWLDGKGSRLRVGDAPIPKPTPDNVIIKNHAIAINPVDWKIQDYGFFVQSWPFILGTDVAGEVVEVGENVKKFKKGDRVLAHVIGLHTGNASDGGFQLYTSAQAATTAILPSSVSFNEGAVLPLALSTAATGLYLPASKKFLGLPYPSLNPSPTGKTLVVYGGSSSVGAVTIQLAVASGVSVITIASKHNFDFCKRAGASDVFDYNSSSVVDDVVKAVKATGGEFIGIYDAISVPDQTYKITLAILEKLGGANLAVVTPPPDNLPANVNVGHVYAINEVTWPVWSDYVTPALEKGNLKPLPEPVVSGKGLEAVQKAVDENKKGVSAKKLVIEL